MTTITPTIARYGGECAAACIEPIQPGDLVTVATHRTTEARATYLHYWCDKKNAPHKALDTLGPTVLTAIRNTMRSPEYRRLHGNQHGTQTEGNGHDNPY